MLPWVDPLFPWEASWPSGPNNRQAPRRAQQVGPIGGAGLRRGQENSNRPPAAPTPGVWRLLLWAATPATTAET